MASMNTRLNIEKLDENIVQKHGGSKQVRFKQLGPGVETGVHEVHDKKRVWFEVELHGAQGDHEVEVFQVSNNDTAVAQRQLKDKQPEEKTNTDCLSRVAKNLGVATIQQQHRFVDETNVTLFAKVLYFLIQSGLSKIFWAEDTTRENNNEDAFAVAAVDKIYAHESLNFNNTVACEVISKWNAGLKDDMDGRSDVYVLSNDYKKSSDDSHDYYWEYADYKEGLKQSKRTCLEIIRDQSGNTLRVSQSSQEYQMVCTRLDIAYADVGMLDKFDRGLHTDVQALSTTEAGYMTFTEAWKKEIWLKGLLTESRYELRLVAGIANDALVKGCSRSEVPARSKLMCIVPDSLDEYLQMGVTTARDSLQIFYKVIMKLYGVLLKSIKNPDTNDHKRILYKTKHKAARKDVERAFGVLKKK
nr:zinc finger, CCHC-type [Tanacetum cinerariifolium]